jgi:hypothetical protein
LMMSVSAPSVSISRAAGSSGTLSSHDIPLILLGKTRLQRHAPNPLATNAFGRPHLLIHSGATLARQQR